MGSFPEAIKINNTWLNNLPVARIINWMIVAIVIMVNYNIKEWKNPDKIINYDIISYYAYLPSTFIYHDLTLNFIDNAPGEVANKVWYEKGPDNSRVIKTTMGLSWLYAPFFFAAHIIAPALGFDANGYSEPYRFALIVSSIFFFACALYFLRKILSEFFSTWVVVLTILTITLGTNLFHYVYTEPTMSHVYSFFLFSVFIFLTIKWYKHPSLNLSVLVGALLGFIILIRPTNILISLVFIFWNVLSFKDVKERALFFLKNYKNILLILMCIVIIWVPQIVYWKIIVNKYFFYSYNTERFYFDNPHLLEGLFGYRRGWLLYTPAMAAALIGIPLMKKQLPQLFIPTLIFNVLNIYIVLSWWCWWYGGGFGQRPFIDSYALQAFPLATFIFTIGKRNRLTQALVGVLMFLFIFLNQFQVKQYRTGAIHWDSMTKEAYWHSFGKVNPPDGFYELVRSPDYEKAKLGKEPNSF